MCLIKLSNSTDQSLMVDDQLLKGNHFYNIIIIIIITREMLQSG